MSDSPLSSPLSLLKSLLGSLLGDYTLVHIRCRAFQTKPLVTSKQRPPTLKVKHFFLLTEKSSQCPVLALEVYIYLTFGENLTQHVFIPKADTTGLGKRVSARAVVGALLSQLLEINPGAYLAEASWSAPVNEGDLGVGPKKSTPMASENGVISESTKNNPASAENETSVEPSVEPQLSAYPTVNALRALARKIRDPADSRKQKTPAPQPPQNFHTKISLFTRAANAYIFPNSERNPGKHLADGNALFSWWVQILEQLVPPAWRCAADLPGAEPAAVNRYLPSRWTRGHLFDSLALAIREIPLFPDDPKGRFLEHLVVEGRYRLVSVKQFWEELGFRQEFRLGSVVGIIGCENRESAPVDTTQVAPGVAVSHKQYKKIAGFVKSEDYAAPDVSAMTTLGLPEVFRQCGVEFKPEPVVGTRQAVAAKTETRAPTVNTLTAKRPAVNNLTGLVRKARK